VVGLVPGRGIPGPQVDRECLAGAVLAVVDERAHRREPEATFEGRLGALLVRVGRDQRGVDVDDHLTTGPLARGAGQGSAAAPHRGSGLGAGLPDRRHRLIDITGQRGEDPGDRRVRCHRSEHLWLGADRGYIGQAVTAQRDCGRDVEQHLPRAVGRPLRPPR
jgi:hypothetical protein